jgi:hypothetical protein
MDRERLLFIQNCRRLTLQNLTITTMENIPNLHEFEVDVIGKNLQWEEMETKSNERRKFETPPVMEETMRSLKVEIQSSRHIMTRQ